MDLRTACWWCITEPSRLDRSFEPRFVVMASSTQLTQGNEMRQAADLVSMVPIESAWLSESPNSVPTFCSKLRLVSIFDLTFCSLRKSTCLAKALGVLHTGECLHGPRETVGRDGHAVLNANQEESVPDEKSRWLTGRFFRRR